MKKTLKTIIALVAAVVLLTGCGMKTESGFKIESNGNIKVQIIMAYDNEMIDAMLTYQEDQNASDIKTHTDAERWAYIESDDSGMDTPDGYKKERYDQGGYKGYLLTQDLGHIDTVSSTSASSRVDIGSLDDFKGQVLFIKNGDTYKSNMTIKKAADTSEYSEYESMGMVIDMKFVVELPGRPISSNATSVSTDGRTLYWDMTKTGDIDFEFTLSGNGGGGSTVTPTNPDPVDEPDDPTEEPTEEPTTGEKKETKKSSKDDDDDDEDSKLPLIIGISVGAGVLLLLIIVAAVAASKKKKANAANVVQPAVMTPTFEQPVQQPTIEPAQPTDSNK